MCCDDTSASLQIRFMISFVACLGKLFFGLKSEYKGKMPKSNLRLFLPAVLESGSPLIVESQPTAAGLTQPSVEPRRGTHECLMPFTYGACSVIEIAFDV